MRPTLAFCALLASVPAQADNLPQPHVDLVIAIDVSGSMRGLLDATRAKLWDVVRLLGRAQPRPQVRVGLITFGGKYYSPADGWVRRELDLTTDLDAVSQRLFALQVRGSQEYVARAVQTGVQQMSWDQDSRALKILFVAGNESAEQDPLVTLASALGEARQRGIHVNSIYCGRPEVREAQAWRKVAALGGGEFASIDHQRSQLAQVTPYDAELGRLSQALSHTYVGYGEKGSMHHANQLEQDKNAAADGPQVAAARAGYKASGAYDNSDWDLVDALAKNKKVEKLPDAVGGLSEAERSAWLRSRLAERVELQRRIRDLSGKRDAFLATGADSTVVAVGDTSGVGSGRGVGGASGTMATATVATPTIATRPMSTATPPAGMAPAAPPPAAEPARIAATSQPAPPKPMTKARRAPEPRSMDEALVGTVRKQAQEKGYGF